jgi:hypothetical protein
MDSAAHPSRRGALAVAHLAVAPVALALVLALVCALVLALFVMGLLGTALLFEGLSSWLHPVDLAAAWARTLAGIGLIGGSAGLAALGWAALERMAGRPASQRARKFVAVVGILLALICLPFAAGIHAAAHGPWLG